MRLRRPLALFTLAAAAPLAAHATNGYFSHGYGIKSQAVAGVGIALPQDALASAANPAGLAALDDRLDLGLTWFRPERSADIVGNGFGSDAHYDGDGRKNFLIPEIGYVRRLSSALTAGLAAYGNGGLNTRYRDNPYARFGATGTAGVNLEQLFVTPSLAWKASDTQAFGVALNVAYQRFSARGIGVFGGFSADPGHVSDQGTDTSTGVGLRLGWQGQVLPGLTLGLTWASKVRGKFDKYSGLFADGGRFDVPENYGAGLSWQASPAWTLAADVQTIRYGSVAAVGNSVSALFAGSPLGSAGGPGFGWRDVTTVKVGVVHQWQSDLVLRAGFSHARQPVPAGETFFNILAPGVVQDHLSLGATWSLPGGGELSGFFAHAFGKTVRGSDSIPPGAPPAGLGGGNADVRLKENIIGIAYGWKL